MRLQSAIRLRIVSLIHRHDNIGRRAVNRIAAVEHHLIADYLPLDWRRADLLRRQTYHAQAEVCVAPINSRLGSPSQRLLGNLLCHHHVSDPAAADARAPDHDDVFGKR